MFSWIYVLLSLCSVAVEEYYVVVFAYESSAGGWQPAKTHNFATWVKYKGGKIVDQVDINWGPEDGARRFKSKVVPGTNKSLKDALDKVGDRRLKYWILKTDNEFFAAAKVQQESLKTKKYKALDHRTRPDAVNCIHACSDVAGYLNTGTASGIEAGQLTVDFFKSTVNVIQMNNERIVNDILKRSKTKLP